MKGHIDSFRGKLTMHLSCFVDSEEEKSSSHWKCRFLVASYSRGICWSPFKVIHCE